MIPHKLRYLFLLACSYFFDNTYTERTGFQLLIATICFAFQIYCDFGSYSNIAIGAARVMGFSLQKTKDAESQRSIDAGIDYTQDFRDYAHMNTRGAEKITKYLGQYLKQNGTYPDHRGDEAFASWERDYEKYAAEAAKKRK